MRNSYFILTPCYNEENVIISFLNEIENSLNDSIHHFTVVVVNDSSTDASVSLLQKHSFSAENIALKLISLNYNMGHQEAIRQGLAYICTIYTDQKAIIVLDSDGEDDVLAINTLVEISDFDVVFVSRGRRKESIPFKVGYFCYKLLLKILIGKTLNFGNYSMISIDVAKKIRTHKFLHYPAFLSNQRFKTAKIVFDRKKRLDGKSKMTYKNLVFHGLNSLIEYSDELLFSLMKLFLLLFIMSFGVGVYILYAKFISKTAIDGWASYLGASLIIASLIVISTIILGLLLVSIKKLISKQDGAYTQN